MADKFQQMMAKLDRIEQKLDELLDREEDDLFGEDSFHESDYEDNDLDHLQPAPRTRVPIKTRDGKESSTNWNDLDPRMQQAVQISWNLQEPYQIYEDDAGKLRIMVSNAVATEIHRRTTPQPKRGDR